MTWEQQWHRPSVLPSFSPTYTPQTETSHCFFRWHQRSLLQVSRQTDTHTKWQMSILTPPKANFFLGKTAGSFGPPKNIWFLYQASDQNPFLPCLFSLQNDFVVFLKAKSPNCAPNHSCTIWETSSSDRDKHHILEYHNSFEPLSKVLFLPAATFSVKTNDFLKLANVWQRLLTKHHQEIICSSRPGSPESTAGNT